MDYGARRAALAEAFSVQGAPALLTDPVSLRYLTGVRLEPHERFVGLVLRPNREAVWVVPALEAEAVRESGLAAIVYRDGEDPVQALAQAFFGPPAALFVEKSVLSLARAEALQGRFPGLRFLDATPAVVRLRRKKDAAERERLRAAAALADAVLAEVLPAIRPGMTERAAAALLEARARERGAEGLGFPPIVLTGRRTALPHGVPGEVPIGPGLLLIDFGVVVDGYHADITRTYWLGAPDGGFFDRYRAVLSAQAAALRAIRPGAPVAEADRAARAALRAHGLDGFFIHRLGHGLGLAVHEAPSVDGGNSDRFEVGDAVTVEPGIYHPEWGGIRIEDDVVVTPEGPEILTRSPKAVEAVVLP
ncbi:MAG: Xaa-Pro peptidase family protein [Hydrogenibacillus schlegelii]|uniref:Aminopeptidase YpdF (MP-, MA-, MS-, AP-, NP-specific) n=1 Tax=Hydrogenibacillus schlegelii TaxID=1484 RepID=A0A2T5GF81_HYDSH|nr:Xaa-Pro peptidase family protein [Hydrogenibacillus schlegelii]MBT9281969.1 Xaa-Pro peptidase family protein [Hydrogenibacillus schlegelii]PTQ54843.1 MAG: Aminopeptidase YpdF (MP-, MA-, MS-, AP-, NP- specific) [Hydrogenibacillus schlegelii]